MLYNLGKTEIDYEGIKINIYDKERMLINLDRNKNKLGYDLYKEIEFLLKTKEQEKR